MMVRLFLLSALLGMTIIGCGANMMPSNKFDWKATESGPENYPMEIISGTLIYRGAPDGQGLYIPAGKTLYYGWGQMVSSHIVGPDLKPLPDRLDITFFSFLEDQHYHGSFDLPYEKILKLFREGAKGGGNPTYDRIMVGVAPGGTVAVWLTGIARTTEVFFGKADPVDLDLMAFGEVIQDREEYVQAELEDTIGIKLKEIQSRGIPVNKWLDLRMRYGWRLKLVYGSAPRGTVDVKYFNGEFERLSFPVNGVDSADRAVPRKVQFTYRSPEGWSYLYIIHFDEEETTTAFEHLGAEQQALQLEFYPAQPISNTEIRLSNSEESVVLEKYFIEDI